METYPSPSGHSGIAGKSQSRRRVGKNGTLHSLIECSAIEITETDVFDIHRQIRLPSQTRIHGQPRRHLPRVLQIQRGMIQTIVEQAGRALLERVWLS